MRLQGEGCRCPCVEAPAQPEGRTGTSSIQVSGEHPDTWGRCRALRYLFPTGVLLSESTLHTAQALDLE